MILTGPAIAQARELGHIRIDPWCDSQVNPGSYDLRLGPMVLQYDNVLLDAKVANTTHRVDFGDEIVLEPGRGYLMHTAETVWSDRYVPVIDGKSSLGRLFVWVHATAGYGDVGFDGQYTLEVSCLQPVRLYVGMRIAQVRFHQTVGAQAPYNGNYQGARAMGAVPSASHQQFAKDALASIGTPGGLLACQRLPYQRAK